MKDGMAESFEVFLYTCWLRPQLAFIYTLHLLLLIIRTFIRKLLDRLTY
jgi:hypothetical protein